MPEVTEFIQKSKKRDKKKSSDWDLSKIASPTPSTRPQRRPGREPIESELDQQPLKEHSNNGTQTVHKPDTSRSGSSSDLKNKTTTTEETECKLSEEWNQIDFSSLKPFGFSETHLIQLARQNFLTPDAVQDSIHAFAFDLEKNQKGKALNSSPVNFFMGILRKGLQYAPPANYESADDKMRREYREALEARAKKRAEEEKRIQVLEFEEWRRGVTSEWIRKNLSDLAWSSGPAQEGSLKNYFEKNIWPSLQNQFQDSRGPIA